MSILPACSPPNPEITLSHARELSTTCGADISASPNHNLSIPQPTPADIPSQVNTPVLVTPAAAPIASSAQTSDAGPSGSTATESQAPGTIAPSTSSKKPRAPRKAPQWPPPADLRGDKWIYARNWFTKNAGTEAQFEAHYKSMTATERKVSCSYLSRSCTHRNTLDRRPRASWHVSSTHSAATGRAVRTSAPCHSRRVSPASSFHLCQAGNTY
ncbi:hypothetical protein BD310DRAFT_436863 [Dichomitus squalens]|uniref:Uncharacterized protein n=1 Tax=Dichomitus squalens TaxID=114155 RepID=A0A4Q9PXE1_9APHY|nr:hypothetical protein BD310DRAFT_436863 [Dichomitus squalens]